MDSSQLLALQAQRGAKLTGGLDSSVTTFDAVVTECRRVIEESSSKYRELDHLEKKEKIRDIIITHVMRTKPLVEGFISDDNTPDTTKLVDALVNDITDYGILTNAMMSEDVFEIRANGKEIKVEINGRVDDLYDRDGKIVRFESPEQQEVIMKKMLGDVKLTPKDAIVNGSTIEGFRIAAVHSSVLGADPLDPTGEKYHAFVLRKFKKQKMGLPEIIRKDTLSDNMGRFLSLLTAGGLTFFTVGPTASGKTTTNNAILQSMPPTTRTILVQNPSEIDLRFKDDSGRVYNDVLHLEAREVENPTPADPTMTNVMDALLRLSPTFAALGEIRSNPEFKQCMKILQAGHPVNSTYHAESTSGAVSRFLTAYLAESGNEPSHLALKTLTELVNIIVVQKIMRDGKRRIIQISEIVGVDEDNPDVAEINDLYRFEIDGDPVLDANGNVVKINGTHKRVGRLSEKTLRKFQLEGVPRSRYDFLDKPVDENGTEVETYTGKNITRYGLA